jgi:hypothetical protein
MPTTQKIFGLARARDEVTWADMVPLMQLEAAHVWSLYERDVLREAWVRTDALGAVYVLEATPKQATSLLADQPMARERLVDFELVPVGPFTPLSLLFGTQPEPVAPISARSEETGRVLALDRLACSARPSDLEPLLADEARHRWALWKGGVIRESYLRTDRPEAALVLEVDGAAGAAAALSALPLVKAGLIEFECLVLEAFMGFDALLEGSLEERTMGLPDPTLVERNRRV